MTERTTPLNVKLTPQELELLIGLASDQLFRREFIDPKMPGSKPNYAETSMGKALVARLRTALDGETGKKPRPQAELGMMRGR